MDAVERVELREKVAGIIRQMRPSEQRADEILDLLLSLARSNGWQDIATAPHSTDVFLYSPEYEDLLDERFGVGRFDPHCCNGAGCWDAPALYGKPTLWCAMPPLDRLGGSENG